MASESKVLVYRNLTKKCYSIVDSKTRRVCGRGDEVELQDCTFRVSQAGRARVLREKKKFVHAFVVGHEVSHTHGALYLSQQPDPAGMVQLYYNPYQTETFVEKASGRPVKSARRVILGVRGVFAEGVEYAS